MPRYCAIVIDSRGIARRKKSAGRIKQAAIPCVKRDLFIPAIALCRCKKTGARGACFIAWILSSVA
jgi:hypothetical protein